MADEQTTNGADDSITAGENWHLKTGESLQKIKFS